MERGFPTLIPYVNMPAICEHAGMRGAVRQRRVGVVGSGFAWATAARCLVCAIWMAAVVAAPASDKPSLPVAADQVVAHVSKSIAWYRRIVALQQLPADPEDTISHDRLNQTALRALRLAFDFGRAAAALAAVESAAKAAPAKTGSSAQASGNGQPSSSSAPEQASSSADMATNFDRAAARL